MRSVAQLLAVASLALALTSAATRVEAQALETPVELEFQNEFSQSEAAFDRRVRRLRSVGWSALWGLLSTAVALIALDDTLFPNDSSDGLVRTALVYPLLMGGGLIIGGALLLRARALVIRRRRFRRRFRDRRSARDRSYFHPDIDIGITAGGLSLHLSF